ncbi:MAG: hypothetical protein M3081_20185 [Gemmatimonadota bacterium]|nr:hypothetical protein [Gemmatimonadota bacterium]
MIAPRARAALLACAAALVASCASGGGGGASSSSGPDGGALPARADAAWPVNRREGVDAWLHAFAMVSSDTTIVPYFKRGYRDQMVVLKNRGNVMSNLDVNKDRLLAGLARNPQLTGAQFLPLYFGTWEQFNAAIDLFLRADGNPRAAQNEQDAQVIALFAGAFSTAADRAWLQLFVNGARDEYTKFYHNYWLQMQRERAPVLARVDTLWQKTYFPKLTRYLRNTQFASGTLLVSLPLDGEGRTITGGAQTNTVAVSFPETESAAIEAVYVFVHEATAPVIGSAVNDNITPAEQRMGVGERYQSAAAVQAGAMLIKRVAPELLAGYAQYYLKSAASSAAVGADPIEALQRLFPLPQAIRDAIGRQLDVVLGGI